MGQMTLCEDGDSIFITSFVGDGGKAGALTVDVPALQASMSNVAQKNSHRHFEPEIKPKLPAILFRCI